MTVDHIFIMTFWIKFVKFSKKGFNSHYLYLNLGLKTAAFSTILAESLSIPFGLEAAVIILTLFFLGKFNIKPTFDLFL